jgi:predicted ABC-type transport system involved in lysophospholipase L1 biosynthesis ATPase subunit
MSAAHLNGSRSQPVITAAGTEAGIRISEVSKVFGRGASALPALDRLSLEVPPGEFVCVICASGCGKSTLLNLVAGLDAPTSGETSTGGQRVALAANAGATGVATAADPEATALAGRSPS